MSDKDDYVRRSEFDELKSIVERLARGQEELQKRQKELQATVKQLCSQVAVLTDARGYGLESLAVAALPSYLHNKYRLRADRFARHYVKVNKKEIELNLFAMAKRGRRKIPVLVECRSQIYKSDVTDFLRKKVRPIQKYLWKETIKVMVSYLIHPSAYKEAKKNDIVIVSGVPHMF